MTVNFFNQPYVLYVGDMSQVPTKGRLRLHIIRRLSLKKKKRAIMIAGWGKK